MHISSDRIANLLTNAELLHIERCSQCQNDREKLLSLKQSANHIELLTPDKEVWQVIKSQHLDKTKHSSKLKQFIYASVASLFFVSVGWLVWNNYSLQQELEQVLLVNQSLEGQLIQVNTPTYHQTQLLSKLRFIDLQLMEAITTAEKLSLLQQRKKLMEEMVVDSQRDNYEYSI